MNPPRADALGIRHLAAQIRLWLAPLLSVTQAHTYRAEVRAFAEYTGWQRLLEAVRQLEKDGVVRLSPSPQPAGAWQGLH